MLNRTESWTKLSALMHKDTGVLLAPEQIYLLEPRLQPAATIHKYGTVEAFVDAACAAAPNSKLRMDLVDAMTTHESYFFRDAFFWGALQNDVLKAFKSSNKKKLRVWSAACSYGQEAYAFAMLVQECAPELFEGLEIHASDVSDAALNRAREGVYTTLEVNRGVSAVRLIRHFEKAPGGFAVKQVLKTKVQWRNENLLRASHAASKFDIVLCRNVLIYFDAHDREIALGHLIDSTTDGGYIGLGTSETFLKPQVAPGWYRHSKTKESSSR